MNDERPPRLPLKTQTIKCGKCVQLETDNAALRQQVEGLREYTRHKSDCPVSLAWGSGPGGTGIKCECGFDKDYKHCSCGFGGWTSKLEASE